jgi:oxaloacetate decarboxylase gamma subunit
MTWIENFWQATVIMVIGMGIVFLFLAALILMMQLAAKIIARYAPPSENVTAPVMANASLQRGKESTVIAAITAAVKQYTADKKNRTE